MLEIQSFRNQDEDYVVLIPKGDIDAYTVAQFREALTNQSDAKRVIVDLCNVLFMDSAGLGALIGGVKRIRANAGQVAVYCTRTPLIRLLHTTGFNRIIPVKETLADAVAAIKDG